MSRVEDDDPEVLDGSRAILRKQECRHLSRRHELRPDGGTSHQRAPAELNRREHLRGACRSDPGNAPQLTRAHAGEPVKAAGAIEEPIGEGQRVASAAAAAQHQREQLVVAESCRTDPLQLLSRPIVRCHVLHRFIYTQFLMRSRPSQAWVLLALLFVACAEPPNKEIDRAQGAIDAARAAGADRYAETEFSAALDLLEQANAAVAQRDYRLALNHALESHTRAQNAAREGASNRARIRGEVEREMAEIAALLAQANLRITEAERSRVPRRVVTDARGRLAKVNDDVQKAGEAMKQDDFLAAQPALTGVKQRIEAVIASLDAAMPQSVRRGR